MAKLTIGVCGGMGAGKSALCERLCALHGWLHISVDEVRRSVAGSDPGNFAALWETAREPTLKAVAEMAAAHGGVVLIEWARLVEDGFLPLADKALIVDCPKSVRMARLSGGDLAPSQIEARMALQMEAPQLASELASRGAPHLLVDASGPLSDLALRELGDELSGAEFSSASPFCLFRIPRGGGRAIWEVTNSCNYGCRYCIFSSTPRKPEGELDTAQALRTLGELAEAGFTHLKITGGEPFSRPDLMEILRRARSLGLRTDVSTNAAFVTEEVASELATLGLEMVHVSLDGPDQASQEAIRGGRTWAPTIAGLSALCGKGIRVRVGCVVHKGNQDRLGEVASLCSRLGCDEAIFSLMEPAGRLRGKEASPLLCDLPAEELRSRVAAIAKEHAGRMAVTGNFPEQGLSGCGSCPGGSRFLFIDHLGRVSPCTWVSERAPAHVAAMTLRTHSLAQILAGPEISGFKRAAQGLAASGLARCPMKIAPALQAASEAEALFAGDLGANLARGGRFSPLSPIYACSTENISGWAPMFDFEGASVLAVGGSGDQAIGALAAGAASVSCFDVNRLARHMAELKLALMRELPFEAYVRFHEDFDHGAYLRARGGLPLESRHFFDLAYRRFGGDGARLSRSPLLRTRQGGARLALNIPHHGSERAYEQARRACAGKALDWSAMTAQEAARARGRRFGAILLSNLADYAHLAPGREGAGALESFRDQVALPMSERLLPGGRMLLAYAFDAEDAHGSSRRSPINDPAARMAAFGSLPGLSYSERLVPSAWEDGNSDIACILEKAP